MVGFTSSDRGNTWPEYMDVMRNEKNEVYFWESKIVETSDGRLLAVAWTYDNGSKKDLPNSYAISADGGKSWTQPNSTGLFGQTLTPFVLDDGSILCVYRRMDKPGLWMARCELKGNEWRTLRQAPLWGNDPRGTTTTTTNMAHNINVLKFGAPCVAETPNHEIFVAFWCYEECVSVIRYFVLN
jgi:hypothetical protein